MIGNRSKDIGYSDLCLTISENKYFLWSGEFEEFFSLAEIPTGDEIAVSVTLAGLS